MTEWVLDRSYRFRSQAVRYAVIGEGPPVVLVHGTPFSSYIWHRVAPHLAQHHQVFVYDLLGYGQSEKRNDQDVSLGVQNELLVGLLEHWALDQPDIIAHDFGGTTTLRAHLLNDRNFHRMMLIDPVVLSPWGSGFDRCVRGHEDAFGALPSSIHQSLLEAYIRGSLSRNLPAQELAPYLEPWLGEHGQPAFYRQIAQFDQRYTDEIERRYSEIRCPTLILWGQEDAWLPIEHGRHLHELIPSSSFRPVPASGHLMQEDAPEAIIAAAVGFLAAGSTDARS